MGLTNNIFHTLNATFYQKLLSCNKHTSNATVSTDQSSPINKEQHTMSNTNTATIPHGKETDDYMDQPMVTNNKLRYTVFGLGVLSSLLLGFILGGTVSSFHNGSGGLLNSNMDIDPHTGIVSAHDGWEHPTLKTEQAIFYSTDVDISGMSNEELQTLKEIVLNDGNVKFAVKGFGRNTEQVEANGAEPVVHVIVEGGTLTWDALGIVDATGESVNLILDAAFPPEEHLLILENGNNGRQRRLPSACTVSVVVGGGSSSARSF